VIHTGYRWHTRAWCEKSSKFRDFVLSRISDAPGITLASTHGPDLDTAWNTDVIITLKPDPRLTPAQQTVIARDYGMKDGQLQISTKGALVSYVLQQLRVDSLADARTPEAQQVVIANAEELGRWLIDK